MLETFVKCFVKVFELKFHFYTSVYDGSVQKCSGTFNNITNASQIVVTSATAVAAAVGGLTAFLGTFAAESAKSLIVGFIEEIGSEKYREVIRAQFDGWIRAFTEEKAIFREQLIAVAIDIFQSYEMQFVHVYSGESRHVGLLKLAEDATNRIISYLKENGTCKLINAEAFVNGTSKSTSFKYMVVPIRGFDLLYKFQMGGEELNSSKLYGKVQIVNEGKYFTNDEKSNYKYGFRRLYLFEMEEWKKMRHHPAYNEIKVFPAHKKHFKDYTYTIKIESLKDLQADLLEKINSEDSDLSEERIKEKISEGSKIIGDLIEKHKSNIDGQLRVFFRDMNQQILTAMDNQTETIKNLIINQHDKPVLLMKETINVETKECYHFDRLGKIGEIIRSIENGFQIFHLVTPNIQLVKHIMRQLISEKALKFYYTKLSSLQIDLIASTKHYFDYLFIESDTKFTDHLLNEYQKIVGVLKQTVTDDGKRKTIIFISYGKNVIQNSHEIPMIDSTAYLNPSFSDLSMESQSLILEKEILFQNRLVRLKTLISAEMIDSDVLLELMKDNSFTIADKFKLVENVDYYIPRTFTQRIEIAEDFLKTKQLGILVISNISLKILQKLSHLRFTSYLNDFERDIGFVIFVHTSTIKFQKLFDIADQRGVRLHWLEYENKKLFWKATRGETDDIRNFIEKSQQERFPLNDGIHFSSYNNIDQLLAEDNHQKCIILCNTIGSGNTTELINMSLSLKNKWPELWVINIDLCKCTRQLLNMKNDIGNDYRTITYDDAVEFVLNALESEYGPLTKLEEDIFRKGFTTTNRVALLFDSFHWICPDYEDLVIALVKRLQESKLCRIVLATRTKMREKLENELGVLSYSMLRFSKVERKQFLEKYWTKNLSLDDNNPSVRYYTSQFLNLMQKGIGYTFNPIINTPFLLRTIADLFLGNSERKLTQIQVTCKDFVATGKTTLMPSLTKGSYSLELYNLLMEAIYHSYLQRTIKMDFSAPGASDQFKVLLDHYREVYQFLALDTVLTVDDFNASTSNKDKDRINQWKLTVPDYSHGIVELTIDDKILFSHDIIPRFLVSEILYNWLSDDKRVQLITEVLVTSILVDDVYVTVRKFLNLELKNRPLPGSCVQLFGQKLTELWSNERERYKFFKSSNYESTLVEVAIRDNSLSIFHLLCDALRHNPMQLTSLIAYRGIRCLVSTHFYSDNKKLVFDMLQMILNVFGSDTKSKWIAFAYFLDDTEEYHENFLKKLFDDGARNETIKYQCEDVGKALLNGNMLMQLCNNNDNEQSRQQILPFTSEPFIAALKFCSEAKDEAKSKETLELATMLMNLLDADTIDDLVCEAVYSSRHLTLIKDFEAKCQYVHPYALHYAAACEHDHTDVVEWLVTEKKHSDIESVNRDGHTALQRAVMFNNLKITKFLIDAGADKIVSTDSGYSLLHMAVRSGHIEMVPYIANVLDVNRTDNYGQTALHIAASYDRLDLIKVLIEHGANIDVCDNNGTEPHAISYRINKETYNWFIENGAPRIPASLPNNYGTIVKATEWDLFIKQNLY